MHEQRGHVNDIGTCIQMKFGQYNSTSLILSKEESMRSQVVFCCDQEILCMWIISIWRELLDIMYVGVNSSPFEMA